MAVLNIFKAVLCTASLASAALGNHQPWLEQSLAYEERLQLFIAQLNTTQKLAMTQGDTEVCRTHQPPSRYQIDAKTKHHSWTRTEPA